MKRALNTRQLEAFRAVMATGGVTAAGRAMAISQPAVTRLIRDLELDLELVLFRREHGGMVPTMEGRELYRAVERYFVSSEQILEAARSIRQGEMGSLRIGCMAALSVTCLPKCVRIFIHTHPEARVHTTIGNSREVIELTHKGELDVGFAMVRTDQEVAERDDFPSYPAVCLMPEGHPLARLARVSAADLDGHDFISLGGNTMMRARVDAAIQLAGARPGRRLDAVYSTSVVKYVQQGLGVAVADPMAVLESAEARQLVMRPFDPTINCNISAIYPRTASLRPLVQGFVQTMKAVMNSEMRKVEALCEPEEDK